MRTTIFLLAAALALPLSAHASDPAMDAGQAAFKVCMACHSAQKGKLGIGPSLFGVYGRKAASLPGFHYSMAMTQSGLTWDEATLDAFITAPSAKVKGTSMPFAGLKDADKRKALIGYLKTLHD